MDANHLLNIVAEQRNQALNAHAQAEAALRATLADNERLTAEVTRLKAENEALAAANAQTE